MSSTETTRRIGHVLTGLDLKTLDADGLERVRQAVLKYSVVVVPQQELNEADLARLAETFGLPVDLPSEFAFGHQLKQQPRVTVVSNIRPDGSIIHDNHAAEYWHNDGDFWQHPRDYVMNFLYSVIVPEEGGDTGFADTVLALETMDPDLRAEVEGLELQVDVRRIPDFMCLPDAEQRFPVVRHQIVNEHAETKVKSLYLSGENCCIVGKSQDECKHLVDRLFKHMESSRHLYHHKWTKGDLLIWDNKTCMHRSMGGYGDHPRKLYRTQCFSHPDMRKRQEQ
eukprot:m.86053 g.86053  ORF g.86053 m.86053 type:complete len:282 (+) comp14449_c0_seq2:355-1200(+)